MASESKKSDQNMLDASQLDTFVMLGYEDYADLLNDVKRDVPGYFDIIRSAIESADPKACTAASHSCRGMLSYFGCITLNQLLDGLENGVLPDRSSAESVHSELIATWEKTLTAIEEWERSVPDFAP